MEDNAKLSAANITYTNRLSVAEYNDLHAAVGWEYCPPHKVRAALDRSDYIVSARVGTRVIGMARVMHDGLQALIMDVMVRPEYQRRGIGTAIMNSVMQFLDGFAEEGGIYVNLAAALGKEGFYTQFGFDIRPNVLDGPGMTKFIVREPK